MPNVEWDERSVQLFELLDPLKFILIVRSPFGSIHLTSQVLMRHVRRFSRPGFEIPLLSFFLSQQLQLLLFLLRNPSFRFQPLEFLALQRFKQLFLTGQPLLLQLCLMPCNRPLGPHFREMGPDSLAALGIYTQPLLPFSCFLQSQLSFELLTLQFLLSFLALSHLPPVRLLLLSEALRRVVHLIAVAQPRAQRIQKPARAVKQ
jgi:hypothetical protein